MQGGDDDDDGVCVCSSEKGLLLSSACAGWDDDDDGVCVCSSTDRCYIIIIVPACTGWDDDVVTPVSVVRQGYHYSSSACAGYT